MAAFPVPKTTTPTSRIYNCQICLGTRTPRGFVIREELATDLLMVLLKSVSASPLFPAASLLFHGDSSLASEACCRIQPRPQPSLSFSGGVFNPPHEVLPAAQSAEWWYPTQACDLQPASDPAWRLLLRNVNTDPAGGLPPASPEGFLLESL